MKESSFSLENLYDAVDPLITVLNITQDITLLATHFAKPSNSMPTTQYNVGHKSH